MIPSVTQVLAPWSDFGGIGPDVLAHAAERGTRVHSACEAISKGLWPCVDDEIMRYVCSFRDWFSSTVEEVVLAEDRLEHPSLGYCGHPDLFCRLKGDEGLAVVDYKTPLSTVKSWPVQVAAYGELGKSNGYDVRRVFTLRLRKNGAPAILDERQEWQTRDFSIFLSCLNAWKYFKGEK